MMFAALKRMEAPAGATFETATPMTPARPARSPPPQWLVAAIGGGLVAVIVATIVFANRGWPGEEPAIARVPTTVPVPIPARVAERIPEIVEAAIPASAPAPAPMPAPVAVAQLPAAQPAFAVEAVSEPEVSVRDAREIAVPEDQAIARHVAAIATAVHGGDLDAAQAQLDALAVILPPRSLTLLRMQAWVAHQRGDSAQALSLYRQIVERMPSDQTAVINLAILEAAHGQAASARQRLQHLRQSNTNSRAIDNAISLVEARLAKASRR